MLKATSSNVNVSQITGVLPVVNGGTGVTTSTGTGNTVLSAAPTLSGNVTLSTGNLIVASGQGIDFSATPGTGTSELLADYEEGTFFPTVIGTTTAGTATYLSQKGVYTKIGNVVYFSIALNWNTGTGTGNLRISSLPFTTRNDGQLFSSITIGIQSNLTLAPLTYPTAITIPNTDAIAFYIGTVGGGSTSAIPYDAECEIECGGFYFI
jgi:hypothetical protein